MTGEPSIGWSDDIECGGGPVLVANVDDFAHWFGTAAVAGPSGSLGQSGHESIHPFAPDCMCYLWHALAGSVRVSVDASRSALRLAQIEYADDDASRAAAHAHAFAFDAVQDAPGLRYRVSTGPVVIAWATNSMADTSTSINRLPLSASTPGALIDFAGGPNAAAVWLKPGMYVSLLFFHEDDRWGISWCTLQRVSD